MASDPKGPLLPVLVAQTTTAKRTTPQNADGQAAPFFLPQPPVQGRHPGTTVSSQKVSEKSSIPSGRAVKKLKEFFEQPKQQKKEEKK